MGHRGDDVIDAMRCLLAATLLFGIATQTMANPRDSKAGSFAAIAYHPKGTEFGWATERRTSREAGAEALKQCGHPRCEVSITVRNACAALARGPKHSKTSKGVTRADAESRALSRCGSGCEILTWTCTK
jgi:hypothetical protein